MRKLIAAALLAAGLGLVGCGAKDVINTAPMTDEEKQKVKEEDQRIADEESQGSVAKAKAKGSKKR